MFYLVEITTYVNSTPDAYAVYSYDSMDGAVAAFHQKMSGAMRNENYASELCIVIDSFGATRRSEHWVRQNVAE